MNNEIKLDKYVLDIHLENPEGRALDDFFRLLKITEKKAPILVSLIPSQIGGFSHDVNFSEEAKGILKRICLDRIIEPVQHGYYHHCPICFDEKTNSAVDFKDPFHEFSCFRRKVPREEIIKKIKAGREIIKDYLGYTPRIFSPPNFLYNESLLDILIEERFAYLMNAMIVLNSPYEYKGMLTVLHESNADIGRKKADSSIFYMHNDKIDFDFIEKIAPNLVSLNKLLEEQDVVNSYSFSGNLDYLINNSLKDYYKLLRDFLNIFKKR